MESLNYTIKNKEYINCIKSGMKEIKVFLLRDDKIFYTENIINLGIELETCIKW